MGGSDWRCLPPLWRGICLLLGLCLTPLGQGADVKMTRQQLQTLKGEIKTLERQLKQFQGESQSLEAAVREAEVRAGQLNRQMDDNRQKIQAATEQLAQLHSRRQPLQEQREVQAGILSQQLAAAYRSGRQDQLKLLLNQQQPERLSRLLKYYEYLNHSRLQAIRQYQQTLDALSRLEQQQRQQQEQLQQQQAALTRNAEQLALARSERQAALNKLSKQISSTDQRLGRLKADRQRLQVVLERLHQTLEKIDLKWQGVEFGKLKGKLKWPTQGKVARGFGSRSAQDIKHQGLLIAAPKGRAVNAVHHGRVVFSDWLRGFGLLIIVDHGGGYMSLYGHNQSLLKEVGDWVSANEAIATVGDSGGLDQTGLYFAIRYKGKPHNPKPWLSRSQG